MPSSALAVSRAIAVCLSVAIAGRVATDGAVGHLGTDVRRLRPKLLIGGVPGDAERSWPGRALAVGDALIACTRYASAAS